MLQIRIGKGQDFEGETWRLGTTL